MKNHIINTSKKTVNRLVIITAALLLSFVFAFSWHPVLTKAAVAGSLAASLAASLLAQDKTDESSSIVSEALDFTVTERGDGWSYIMKVPEEWAFIEYGGLGETTLVDTFYYYYPAIRMTYWGLQEVPGSTLTAQLSGVPIIMANGTVSSFVELLPEISILADLNGQLPMPDETRVLSVEILDVDYVSAVTDTVAQAGLGGMICDESIVKARMILDDGYNTEVTALIYGTVAYTSLGDFLSYSVMNIYGIFAPPEIFDEVARTLAERGCGEYAVHETYLQTHPDASYDKYIYANSYQQWRDYILSKYFNF